MEGSRETMETVDGSRDRESYIYIDDEDSNKFPAIGRPSVAGNEDDYDYAIELVPDVEYRKSAKILGNISDFEDADEYIENLLMEEEEEVEEQGVPILDRSSVGTSRDAGRESRSSAVGDERDSDSSSMSPNGPKKNSSFFTRFLGVFQKRDGSNREAPTTSSPNRSGVFHSPIMGKKQSSAMDLRLSPFSDIHEDVESAKLAAHHEGGGGDTSPESGSGGGEGLNSELSDGQEGEEEELGLTAREAASIISKRQFLTRIGVLSKKRNWVEKAARRSSIGFHEKYNVTDKAVMDAFLVAMTSGVHLRRHQKGRFSEMVRMGSEDGCKTVGWGQVNPVELAFQRSREGVAVNPNDKYAKLAAKHMHEAGFDHEFGGMGYHLRGAGERNSGVMASMSDCLGCRDDQDDRDVHHRAQQILRRRRVRNSTSEYDSVGGSFGGRVSESDTSDVGPKGADVEVERTDGWLSNMGYVYSGTFKDGDIVAVHPANREDPTALGNYGTSGFRESQDAHNAALSFSVVIKSSLSSLGFTTLDIEAEAEETYCLLLQGFRLLQDEADIRRATHILDDEERNRLAETLAAFRSVSYSLWQVAAGGTLSHNSAFQDPLNALEAGGAQDSALRASRMDPVNTLFDNRSDGVMSSLVRGGDGTGTLTDDDIVKVRSGSSRADAVFDSQQASRGSYSDSRQSSASGDTEDGKRSGYVLRTETLLPPAQFLGWKSAGTQIWARLKMAGLEVKCVFSYDLSKVILKVRAPQWRLEEVAEVLHIKKRNRDGTLRRFKVNRRDTFLPDSDEVGQCASIFKSSERQQIIDYIIRSKIKDGGAELGEDTPLGGKILQRFPLHMQSRLAEIRHSWVTFWRQERPGSVSKAWSPVSEPLQVTASRFIQAINYALGNVLVQPLDAIAEYYGEGVAFYYAFAAFYTRWLITISALGLLVFCFQVSDLQLDHWLCMPYSIVVMVWTCFFLVYWRQRSASLAYRWGVLDYEMQETERPQFRGKRMLNPSTGEIRKVYPVWRRVMKYMQSIPVIMVVMALMLSIMSTVFTTQDKLLVQYQNNETLNYYPEISLHDRFSRRNLGDGRGMAETEEEGGGFYHRVLATNSERVSGAFSVDIDQEKANDPDFWAVTFFFPCLYGVLTNIMVALFNLIAIRINNFENHRTQSQYMNRLVLKVITFRFVAIFTTLYYYAFWSDYDSSTAYLRMAVTIFGMMTAGQWTGAFIDICVPALIHRWFLYRMTVNISRENKLLYKAKEFSDDKKHELWGVRYQQMRRMTMARISLASRPSMAANTLTSVGEDREEEEEDGAKPGLDSEPEPPNDLDESSLRDHVSALVGAGVASMSGFPEGPSAVSANDIEMASGFGQKDASRVSVGGTVLGKDSRESVGTTATAVDAAEKVKADAYISAIDSTIARRAKYLQDARGKCWEESLMAHYRSFTDYSSLMVQIGFVIFFSPVFPLAPLIALINNLLLLRLGAFKMTYTRQRPIATKSSGIGVWEDVLQIMSVVAILTNCCLLGLTSSQLRNAFPSLGDIGLAVGLFALEHSILFFKYWLHTAIPRIPKGVQYAIQREQNFRDRSRDEREREKTGRAWNGGGGGGGASEKKKKRKKKNRSDRQKSTEGGELSKDKDQDGDDAVLAVPDDFNGDLGGGHVYDPSESKGDIRTDGSVGSGISSGTGSEQSDPDHEQSPLTTEGGDSEAGVAEEVGARPILSQEPLVSVQTDGLALDLNNSRNSHCSKISPEHPAKEEAPSKIDDAIPSASAGGKVRESVCGTLEVDDRLSLDLHLLEGVPGTVDEEVESGSTPEDDEKETEGVPASEEGSSTAEPSTPKAGAEPLPPPPPHADGSCALCGRSPVKCDPAIDAAVHTAPTIGTEREKKRVRFAMDNGRGGNAKGQRRNSLTFQRSRDFSDDDDAGEEEVDGDENSYEDSEEDDEWEESDSDSDSDSDREGGGGVGRSTARSRMLGSYRAPRACPPRGAPGIKAPGGDDRRSSWLDTWHDKKARSEEAEEDSSSDWLAAGGGSQPGQGLKESTMPRTPRADEHPHMSPKADTSPPRSPARAASALPADEQAWESSFFSKINEITAAVSAMRMKSDTQSLPPPVRPPRSVAKPRSDRANYQPAASDPSLATAPPKSADKEQEEAPSESSTADDKSPVRTTTHPFAVLLTPPGGKIGSSTATPRPDKMPSSAGASSTSSKGKGAAGTAVSLEEKLRAAEKMLHGSQSQIDTGGVAPALSSSVRGSGGLSAKTKVAAATTDKPRGEVLSPRRSNIATPSSTVNAKGPARSTPVASTPTRSAREVSGTNRASDRENSAQSVTATNSSAKLGARSPRRTTPLKPATTASRVGVSPRPGASASRGAAPTTTSTSNRTPTKARGGATTTTTTTTSTTSTLPRSSSSASKGNPSATEGSSSATLKGKSGASSDNNTAKRGGHIESNPFHFLVNKEHK